MTDKKEDSHIEKLEKEFKDFQKDWKKFLTNDFSHLAEDVKDVKGLKEQNTSIQQQLGRIEENTLKVLGARAYDWGNKGNKE